MQKLSRSDRAFLISLGTPALGMAFTVTVVASYVPVVLQAGSSPIVIGALVGAEGFFGIFVPALVGNWSDRKSRVVRDRLPPLVVSAGLVVLALVAIGVLALLGLLGVWASAAALVLLYVGYYGFLAPYWTLYPDTVPDEQSGRSVSAEGTWRVVGTGLGLISGGLLLGVATGLPFLAAAALVTITVLVLVRGLRSRGDVEVSGESTEGRPSAQAMRDLLRDPYIRRLSIANALWNFALMALRAFVVLYFVAGLDRSTTFVATVVFPAVAVGIVIGAPLSGWLADRFGHVRLLVGALLLWGIGMAVPAFDHRTWVVGIIPVVALGAAVVMVLPLSVLMRLVPEERHGAASGLFGVSRGVGSTLGPVVTGVAVVLLGDVWPVGDSDGYGAMWLVCSVALLASVPFTWALRRSEDL
jgi:MFS family permease